MLLKAIIAIMITDDCEDECGCVKLFANSGTVLFFKKSQILVSSNWSLGLHILFGNSHANNFVLILFLYILAMHHTCRSN